jgi:hypothetical protein
MLRLTPDEYDDAVELVASALALADQRSYKTYSAKAMLALEVLGDRYNISPALRSDLPLANEETDDAIAEVWAKADEEVDRANALFDWVRGERP